MKAKSFTQKIEYDEFGEPVITFDPEVLELLGWEIGDTITWVDNQDGSYTLVKVELDES